MCHFLSMVTTYVSYMCFEVDIKNCQLIKEALLEFSQLAHAHNPSSNSNI